MAAVVLAILIGVLIGLLLGNARQQPVAPPAKEEPSAPKLADLKPLGAAAKGGIIGLDRDQNVVALNAPARHMLGGICDDTPFPWPQNIHFLSATDRAPIAKPKDPITRALGGQAFAQERLYMNRVKQPQDAREVKLTSMALSDQDNLRTVLVLEDITSSAQTGQNLRDARAQRDLFSKVAAGMVNDFNNLLATISYAIDLGLKQTLPEKAESLLMTALVSVERGQDLTRRLLALTRNNPGQPTTRALTAILDDVEVFTTSMLGDGVTLDIECVELDLSVHCNQVDLEGAILELIQNARDAILERSGTGRISITVRAFVPGENVVSMRAASEGQDDLIEITIADDGPGMPREVARQVMETGQLPGGAPSSMLGQGLADVRNFVAQSAGYLGVATMRGGGTSVTLALPRGHAVKKRETAWHNPLPKGNGETVFLVEDEPMLLLMIQEELEDLGYRVISATSGKAALGLIEQGVGFDLVITDVVMPGGINGFDLAAQLQGRNESAAIIYMSGYSGFSKDEMGAVVAPLLKKPCAPNELADAVQTALKARSA